MSSARPNRRRPRPQPRVRSNAKREAARAEAPYQADRDSGLINDYRPDQGNLPPGG